MSIIAIKSSIAYFLINLFVDKLWLNLVNKKTYYVLFFTSRSDYEQTIFTNGTMFV